jgi:hypothetical protein
MYSFFAAYHTRTDLRVELSDNITVSNEAYIKLYTMQKAQKLTTKRFVIRKSLIGKNVVITFTNKNKEKCTYNHDLVYEQLKERFEAMPCFAKYSSYTNSNNLPKFVRDLDKIV